MATASLAIDQTLLVHAQRLSRHAEKRKLLLSICRRSSRPHLEECLGVVLWQIVHHLPALVHSEKAPVPSEARVCSQSDGRPIHERQRLLGLGSDGGSSSGRNETSQACLRNLRTRTLLSLPIGGRVVEVMHMNLHWLVGILHENVDINVRR
jgi:hypothetical protein